MDENSKLKIRKNLNQKLFTEKNVEELLTTLDGLYNNFETLINADVDGGEIASIFLKAQTDGLLENPIFKSMVDYQPQKINKMSKESIIDNSALRIQITNMDSKNKITIGQLISELSKAHAKGVIDYDIIKTQTGSCWMNLYLHLEVPSILDEIEMLRSKIEDLELRAQNLNCDFK